MIELLVVIILIAFIISVVSPTGYRLYESFEKYLNTKAEAEKIKDLKFQAFATQTSNPDYNISMLGVDYLDNKTSHNND
ncbi:type II secretion system protein [Sulfurimonas sp. MAG313]|nr:type II secretion system protein [Sulfurimonas sp. MAG313]